MGLLALPKILSILLGLEGPLQGVRILGQEEFAYGAASALVTVFERDGVPVVLVRMSNSTDAEIWWSPRGGRTSAGSWSLDFHEVLEGGFGTSARGCSPVRPERAPRYEELEMWSIAPGSHVFYERPYDAKSWLRATEDLEDVSLDSWSTSFDLTLPLDEQPEFYFGSWVNGRVQVDVDFGGNQVFVGARRR